MHELLTSPNFVMRYYSVFNKELSNRFYVIFNQERFLWNIKCPNRLADFGPLMLSTSLIVFSCSTNSVKTNSQANDSATISSKQTKAKDQSPVDINSGSEPGCNFKGSFSDKENAEAWITIDANGNFKMSRKGAMLSL